MTVLNAIVAKQLQEFKEEVDALIVKKGMKKDDAIFNVLREYIKDSKRIRFEGDGYGAAWEKEAAKRKLSNAKNTPEALKAKISKESISLFESLGILSKTEVEARYEIEVEEYALRIQIESRVLGDIARNHVVPTAIRYQNILLENIAGLKAVYGKTTIDFTEEPMQLLEQISGYIRDINKGVAQMILERKQANVLPANERAEAYCSKVLPHIQDIRRSCDKLELLVDDQLWPLTKYRELLFTN